MGYTRVGGERGKIQMDRGVIIPNSTSAPLSHIPILTIIQPTLHNSNNVRLREIGIWGHLRCALKCGPAEGTGTHLSWHPRQINTYKGKKKNHSARDVSPSEKKTTAKMNRARHAGYATGCSKQRRWAESTHHLRDTKREYILLQVILNGTFHRLTQAWVF